MHSKLALAVSTGALLLFAACSPAATSPSATQSAAAATTAASTSAAASGSTAAGGCAEGATGAQTVTIAGFAFAPNDVTVAAGSSVTWTNNDSASHTATADDGSFDCSVISQGKSFTYTFPTAGTFSYHCKFHPQMVAKITVT